jgi:ankyrin repeat protein
MSIHEAARSNKAKNLKNYKEFETDKDVRESGTGQTPLMAATLAGAAKSVEYLLKKRADATIPEKDGYTPFHGAGFQGRAEVAKLLLEYRLDPSDRHKDGSTPIHRACWGREQRHTDVVKLLVENGVSAYEANTKGQTCLDMTSNKATKDFINNLETPSPGSEEM